MWTVLRRKFCGWSMPLIVALCGQVFHPQTFGQATEPTALAALPTESFDQPSRNRAGPQVTLQVESLIAQLEADPWRVRQRALDTLVDLGADVLPRLGEVVRSTGSEDVRARAESAIRQIEDIRATGTSLVTLKMRGVTPAEVFAELARQGNTELHANPANLWKTKAWPRVDVDFDRVPFWVAMREACEKVGVSPKSAGNDREMEIVDRGSAACGRTWGDAPSVVVGPFMVSVMGSMRSDFVDLQTPEAVKRTANVQLLIFAEPKLRVLQGTYSARLREVVDAAGNSLLSPGLQQEGMQPVHGWAMSLSASLTPHEATTDRIALLRGSGRFLVQTRSESAQVENALNASDVSRAVAGKRFTLKEVRRSGDNYVASITLYRSGWSVNEWSMMHPYPQFRLLDKMGRPMQRVHTSGHGGGHEQSEITLHFAREASEGESASAEPATLVWEVATETREVVVPFEFRDLPLP